MGHHWSDAYTEKELRLIRLEPERKKLQTYDEEVARGLIHTPQWNVRMEGIRLQLEEARNAE